MSPRIEVLPLKQLCKEFIIVRLIHAVSSDEEIDYEGIHSYLEESTFEVLQNVLNSILSTYTLDASIRFNCLQLLLREDVRQLELDVFPHSYYENILRAISERGIGLEYLNLKGIWARENVDLLCTLLERLKKLKILIIPHIANDDILMVTKKYGKLAILDISGECSFSSEILRNFKSESLKILSIGYYGKKSVCNDEKDSSETVAKMLFNLPNLVSLQTYSFCGNALLKALEKDPQFKTNLAYLHDTDTTEDTARTIVQTCPKLSSICLNEPGKGALKILTNLKFVHTLKLSKVDDQELMDYLVEVGSQIQVLKLLTVKDNAVDLGKICKFAPNLISLECFKMSFTCSCFNYLFMFLESVEFSYCNTSNCIIRFLLMNSPNLQRLVIGDRVKLSDGDMFRICAESELLLLEELWFASARYLTASSVELLMKHCPKLKLLGQISGWDLSPNDINFLKAVIVSTNTDLTFLTREGFI